MKLLLVDGNEKEASDRYTKIGMDTQFEVYKKILKKNSKDNLNVTLIHPAVYDEYLPKGVNLNDFDAKIIDIESIYSSDIDVYAPCALGGTVNDFTITSIYF